MLSRNRSESTVDVPPACPLKKKGSITTCTITTHHIDTFSECGRTCMTLTVRILHHILLFWWFVLQMTWKYDFSDKRIVSKKLDIRNDVDKKRKTPTATKPPITILFFKLLTYKIVFAFSFRIFLSTQCPMPSMPIIYLQRATWCAWPKLDSFANVGNWFLIVRQLVQYPFMSLSPAFIENRCICQNPFS